MHRIDSSRGTHEETISRMCLCMSHSVSLFMGVYSSVYRIAMPPWEVRTRHQINDYVEVLQSGLATFNPHAEITLSYAYFPIIIPSLAYATDTPLKIEFHAGRRKWFRLLWFPYFEKTERIALWSQRRKKETSEIFENPFLGEPHKQLVEVVRLIVRHVCSFRKMLRGVVISLKLNIVIIFTSSGQVPRAFSCRIA